ncbi:O-antigen ligase family protein [Occallatibacter riparius]|uniref:O-antigen ligase family protein n=1 Tax=Occallatibacter riparius TaxID=1002689 RepID=A0A9J7BLU4_9BACT|nr:O-antigen ligase family protein [Occallatibacter riparius]UWZ83720.1 O-antigen ligase family protein [Occallatibacter riparius]
MQPRLIERLFVVVFLLYNMGVLIALMRPYEAETDPSAIAAPVHVTDVVIQAVIQLWGAGLVISRGRQIMKALRTTWPLLALVSFAVMSTAWSSRPDLTFRRSSLLFVSMLLAVYIGERFSIEEQVRLISLTFCVMIVAILILRVAASGYVVDYVSHPGAWKGLSGYKNAFGQYMGTAALLFIVSRFKKMQWARYVFLAAALAMLLFAQSAASVLCFLLMLPLIPLWRSTRISGKQRLPVFTGIAVAMFTGVYVFMTHAGRVFEALGRNSNMSGRSDLWAYVWAAALKRPVLGYGYDTFWAGLGEALEVRMGIGWMAQRSDNGYLDFMLGLGGVGVILLLCLWFFSFKKAMTYLQLEQRPFAVWPITYMAFYVLHNLSESTLLARGGLPDLLFMATAVSLAVNHQAPAEVPSAYANDRSASLVRRLPVDASYHPGVHSVGRIPVRVYGSNSID